MSLAAQAPADVATCLSCDQVSKAFGRNQVLQRMSLEVRAGEFLSLLGPSGCGKTTLLRIVAGLERADQGHVSFQGEDIGSLPAALRGFGIVFQSYALYPNMTALENVGFGLRARGLSRRAWTQAAQEMLTRVGLADSAGKLPAQLSGGQQQRVALARVLVLSPRLLLLDEPFSALDARVRFQLRLQVREMQRELGITTILVTHDQEEAMMVSDRVALMREGQLEQIGTPREIYAAPRTEFAADFIGTMDFFRGSQLADLDPSLAQGEGRCLAIRPESFAPGLGGPGAHTLEGRLVDLEFRGPVCRAILETKTGLRVMAELSPRAVDANGFIPGRQVQLHVPQSSVLKYRNGLLQGAVA